MEGYVAILQKQFTQPNDIIQLQTAEQDSIDCKEKNKSTGQERRDLIQNKAPILEEYER